MANDYFDIQQHDEEQTIRLQDFLQMCLVHWKWFVVSVITTIVLALIYLFIVSPTYTRTASLLIKDEDSNSSISSQLSSLSELGVFSSGANVTNEMVALQSPSVILEVVRRLNLDMSYITSKNSARNISMASVSPLRQASKGIPRARHAHL